MGVIGFVLIKLDFAMPPIILGLVLGSLAEKNARRSIDLLGSSETIWQHPIAIIFIVLAIASLVSPAISAAIKKRKAAKARLLRRTEDKRRSFPVPFMPAGPGRSSVPGLPQQKNGCLSVDIRSFFCFA